LRIYDGRFYDSNKLDIQIEDLDEASKNNFTSTEKYGVLETKLRLKTLNEGLIMSQGEV